jgi:hypothetical protein
MTYFGFSMCLAPAMAMRFQSVIITSNSHSGAIPMHPRREPIRDFTGKRWLNVVLRTAHLFGIVIFGAALLGNGKPFAGALLTFVSGAGMFAIDTWANPGQLREIAGFGIVLKLGLIGLAVIQPDSALAMFWLILVVSTVLSHAPGGVRHKRIF